MDEDVDAPVALSISALTKRFAEKVVVDELALDVHRGTIVGLLGPNGAGKTTAMRMMTGILRPTRGTVRVHGAS